MKMNISLQKTLTGGCFVMNTLFSKLGGQCLAQRISKLNRLKVSCAHVVASFLDTDKCLGLVHRPENLKGKSRNGSSCPVLASVWKRSSSISCGSTSKWSNEGQNFMENENEYFHSYLESVDEYQPYFLSFSSHCETDILPHETVTKLLQEVKEGKKADKLLLLLAHWSAVGRGGGCSVPSNQWFSQTVYLLPRNVTLFTVEELVRSMACLNNLGLRQTLAVAEPRRNRIIISKAFDHACIQHIEKMDVKDLLLAADFFYSMRGSSFAKFNFLMFQRMKFFLPIMTKPELLLLLFHASMTRKTPVNMVHTVMDHLRQHLTSLTLQELGVVNLAHYKTQSLVKHAEYFSALTAQLKADKGLDINSVCLSAVLKYQHRSLNRRKDQIVPQFFTAVQDIEDALLQRVDQMSSQAVMRVFDLYYSLDLLSEDLFMAVINRIAHQGVQDWRLKDVAKVVHILSNIPVGSGSSAEILETILADLQRQERQPEMDGHPSCLLQIAMSLTFIGMYPHWLLRKVFGPSAQKCFKDSKINYRQDLLHLSQSVRIEDRSYQGPLLQSDRFPRVTKSKVYDKLAESREGTGTSGSLADHDLMPGNGLFQRDILLLELMDVLRQTRPDVSPVPAFLLPHFHTADVEMVHKQESGTEDQAASASSSLQHVMDKKVVREAVVLHASNAYQTVRHSDGKTMPLLRQYHAMRVRQLRALGTSVIEVPHFEFEASSDKCQYLLTKFQQEQDRLQDAGHR